MPASVALPEYYRDSHVHARIGEYCGIVNGGPASAVFIASQTQRDDPFVTWEQAPRHRVDELDELLATGADVARSMWDRESLLFHLDFDYLNLDAPSESYTHAADVFYKIEPAYRAAVHVFARHGLTLLPLVTGRGYHFTGRVPLDSPVVDRLAALSEHSPAWLRTFDERRPMFPTPPITDRHARAWAGTGLLVEFLAHQIVRRARPRSPLPVVLNNTVVGTGEVGRECLSIDLSYAGDPLDVRHIRIAFSAYQKHRFRPDISGSAASHGPMAAVPRVHDSLAHMLVDRSDLRHAERLARTTSAVPPDTSRGVERLLEAYVVSPLARFHREFSRATPNHRDANSSTRQAAVRDLLPPCVLRALQSPNDLLLQPSVIQHVTRVLMAEGLPPRDIAAVIQGRYDADHGWGRRWNWMNAEWRALVDVRVFSGMVATGLDEAIDLNCRSAQEKGLCPGGACALDLRTTRAQLLKVVRS